MRVILVDDEKELVSTLAERLGYRGIEADWAITPDDAIVMTQKKTYDIAVLDVKMPGIDGFELKRKLQEYSPKLKYIFMTGHGSEECYDIGCTETGEEFYLVKPVQIDQLVEKMDKVLAQKGKS
ncbi:response regulator [Desulfobacula phenolica]|uniref:Response regulator receiver domain-containing protein n=1 Tax=Desulfobacula phenolica TaxID=90732 RepID=A0A1H2DM25_9BACT|nr:response regulator [Desulfobacula phenolica]SDT83801.1 Response regulator receiver domain-containing protein [Desulfobacula phenolica]